MSEEPYSDEHAFELREFYCEEYCLDAMDAPDVASQHLSRVIDRMLASDQQKLHWFCDRLMLSNAAWGWGEINWICELAYDWKGFGDVVEALNLLAIIKTKGKA